MRGRRITAAITLLSCGIFGAAPALAQDEAARARLQPLPLTGIEVSGFDPFPKRVEFGVSNYSFSAYGEDFSALARYSGVPSYDWTGAIDEIVTLRDVYVSAAVLPGIQIDLARWSYAPGSQVFRSGLTGYFGAPFAAANGFSALGGAWGQSGTYAGAAIGLTDEISLSFGRMSATLGAAPDSFVTPLPTSLALQLSSQAASVETTTLGLDWNVTDWAELGVSASRSLETASVIGDALPSAVRLSPTAETVALGISARVGFGEGWVTTVAYNEGITQLDLNSAPSTGFDPMRNHSYGFSVAKQGVFGDDALGITVSQPMGFYGGTNFASLALSSVLNARPDALNTRESDFTLGYVTTFMDGAFALQANAAYRLNANGEAGQDEVSVLSRAQIKF